MTSVLDMTQAGSCAATDEAAGWYVRMRLGEPSADDRRAFDAWLAIDPAHRRAYDEYERLWAALGPYGAEPNVIAARRELLANEGPRRVRVAQWRAALIAAAAVLAVVAAGLSVMLDEWRVTMAPELADSSSVAQHGRFVTGIGERSTVPLEDGSTIVLNTNSEVEPAYSATQRTVRLIRGQALFEVAKDAGRPFVVHAGGRRIVALGTAFDVRLDETGVRVTLVDGRVSVETIAVPRTNQAAAEPAPQRAELEPGEQLIATGNSTEVRRADIAAVTSWRDGRLIFSDEALMDAVAEVNRYTRTKLILADPALHELRLSGVFRVGQVGGFVSALEARFPIRVAERDAERVVLVLRNGPA